MIDGKRILAVVPARSGSKGVAHKNMRTVQGLSLIGWAGRVLAMLPDIDARIISTDSPDYAREAEAHGLDAPFLRPPELATDDAPALDTIVHALHEMEQRAACEYDVVLIVEPTSPLRLPDDIMRTLMHVVRDGRDSAVAVSTLEAKWHPRKALGMTDGRIVPALEGSSFTWLRQGLEGLFWRNGVCYAIARDTLLRDRLVIGNDCGAEVIEHPVVNIDADWEFEWAEFLLEHRAQDIARTVLTDAR